MEQRKECNDIQGSIELCLVAENQVSRSCFETSLELGNSSDIWRALLF